MKPYKHYIGGKGTAGTYQKIINQIPPHKYLIIPFLGNCAIVRNIKPCDLTIGIDNDARVIDQWGKYKGRNLITHVGDGIEFLKNLTDFYNQPHTVVYCDPPYLISTRSTKRKYYRYELNEHDHINLLCFIKSLKCRVLISCYPNDLYSSMLSNWNSIKYFSSTRKGKKLEQLYFNFSNPDCILHDYKFAGVNYRDRERILKKVTRFENNINSMKSIDKNVIIDKLINQDYVQTNFIKNDSCSITNCGDRI